jgi:hypothetical protein
LDSFKIMKGVFPSMLLRIGALPLPTGEGDGKSEQFEGEMLAELGRPGGNVRNGGYQPD